MVITLTCKKVLIKESLLKKLIKEGLLKKS